MGNGYADLSNLALWNVRIPGGHPEGFIEAFANIYRNFAKTVRAKALGQVPQAECLDFPDVHEGVRGMQFIETMWQANQSDGKWTKWVEQ